MSDLLIHRNCVWHDCDGLACGSAERASPSDVARHLVERGEAVEGQIYAGNKIVFEVPGPGRYAVIPLEVSS